MVSATASVIVTSSPLVFTSASHTPDVLLRSFPGDSGKVLFTWACHRRYKVAIVPRLGRSPAPARAKSLIGGALMEVNVFPDLRWGRNIKRQIKHEIVKPT